MEDGLSKQNLSLLKRMLAKGEYTTLKSKILALKSENNLLTEADLQFLNGLEEEIKKRDVPLSQNFESVTTPTRSVSQITCPSCRSVINLTRADTMALTCSSCLAALSFTGEAADTIKELQKPKLPLPLWYLKVGQIGEMFGVQCQIIGRLRYEGVTREWDPEDNLYLMINWSYDEWVIVNSKNEYRYITEEDDNGTLHYFLSEEFIPNRPPKELNSELNFLSLDNSGFDNQIQEKGTYSLVSYEGEFSYIPLVGEQFNTLEYSCGNYNYSVEWSITPDGSVKEVEFFKSESISAEFIAKSFGFQEFIKELEDQRVKSFEYNFLSLVPFGIAGILTLLLVILSLKPSFVRYSKVATYNQIEDGLTLGPFTLDKVNAVHEVRFSSQIPDNSEIWVGVELLDEDQNPLNAFDHDFWRESGRDSDGDWSEGDTTNKVYFKLSKPGIYFLRLFGEIVHGKETILANSNVSVYISEPILMTRYLLWGALLALGYGISLRFYRSSNPLLILLGIMSLGVLIFNKLEESESD